MRLFSAAVKFREHKFILICVAFALAFCGVFAAVSCDCHSDELNSHAGTCACDCVCCSPAGVMQIADSGSNRTAPLSIVRMLPHIEDSDSGRLIESFIFTPPRA